MTSLMTLPQAESMPKSRDILPAILDAQDERPDWQFLYVIESLILDACRQFRQGVGEIPAGAPFDVATVDRVLLESWTQDLTRLLSRTLVLELNVARLESRLDGRTPAERFQSFVQRLRDPKEAARILNEYPLLAGKVGHYLRQSVEFTLEFLQHLCRDWDELLSVLAPAAAPGRIVRIDGQVGDRHCGGRSVLIATFESGWKVVYKPRPHSIDVHFQELLSWLNERGDHPPFRLLKIVDREDHGWVEFVEHTPCSTPDEVRRFYERQGACLAVLYALGATDFHFENVLASGEHPVLIDLESLFHPSRPRHDENDIDDHVVRATLSSVLSVGLLPHRLQLNGDTEGIDISGMGATEKQLSPDALPYWERCGADDMHLARRRMPLAAGRHRPMLAGADVRPLEYSDAVVAGFDSVYRLLLRRRDELLSAASPLRRFEDVPIRAILRHTRIYGLLLDATFHPDALRDEAARNRLFDYLTNDVKGNPRLSRVLDAERRDLENGDIPFFSTRPNSLHLWDSRGTCIPSYFDEANAASLDRGLRRLSEDDLSRQTWLIRASLATTAHPQERPAAAFYSVNDSFAAIDPAGLTAAAAAIGDRLESLALRSNDEAVWMGVTLVNDRQWSLVSSGLDLYSGLPGIALFLAYLAEATADERRRDLAGVAVNALTRYVDRVKSLATATGAFTGWGGVIYALSHLGALWNRSDLLEQAREIAEQIPGLVERDQTFDIIGGAAGCIAGLTNLHGLAPSPHVLQSAIECGNWLLDRAEPMESGIGWVVNGASRHPLTGFSHGAAGIAWSLAKLASVTGEARFQSAALAAVQFERSLYSKQHGNWPDRREDPAHAAGSDNAPPTYMTAWCNGAPGIGLARLDMLPRLDDGKVRDEIEIAVRTTLSQGFGQSHSLCHGDLGNIELLTRAAQTLNDEHLREQANRLAAGVVDSFHRHGWLCGTPMHVETPGLMTGLAGIGYGLLRLAAPQVVPSVLLLEGPALHLPAQRGGRTR